MNKSIGHSMRPFPYLIQTKGLVVAHLHRRNTFPCRVTRWICIVAVSSNSCISCGITCMKLYQLLMHRLLRLSPHASRTKGMSSVHIGCLGAWLETGRLHKSFTMQASQTQARCIKLVRYRKKLPARPGEARAFKASGMLQSTVRRACALCVLCTKALCCTQ